MNKKLKVLSSVICGLALSSGLAFTSVQAAGVNNNTESNLSASYITTTSATTYTCTAYAGGYNNVKGSVKPSDTLTHTYRSIVIFYDSSGTELDELDGSNVVEYNGKTYTMNYGSYTNWAKADVHFYADNSPIYHTVVYQ